MHIVILATAKDVEESGRIAKELIKDKLAACVNIVENIQSVFWWEGKVDRSGESLLIIKSRQDRFQEIVNKIKSVHSYSVPEIIALPIVEGSENYLKWIDESVSS